MSLKIQQIQISNFPESFEKYFLLIITHKIILILLYFMFVLLYFSFLGIKISNFRLNFHSSIMKIIDFR